MYIKFFFRKVCHFIFVHVLYKYTFVQTYQVSRYDSLLNVTCWCYISLRTEKTIKLCFYIISLPYNTEFKKKPWSCIHKYFRFQVNIFTFSKDIHKNVNYGTFSECNKDIIMPKIQQLWFIVFGTLCCIVTFR